jgi:uncharacterized protein
MVIMDRQGIHIDYCTSCHGVYLDRGELDKLIQMATMQMQQQPAAAMPQQSYQNQPVYPQQPHYAQPQQGYRRDYDDDDNHYHYKKKKRKGFLDDIFDFD